MGERMPLGLYLHVPFCKSRCLYCDFCTSPRPTEEMLERYVARMERDLLEWSERCRAYTVDTVYFGGGTPTLLGAERLERLLSAVLRSFSVVRTGEITAECNPATASREMLARMRRVGFNRLSIGAQSMHREELLALGRIHTVEDFYRTWEDARAAGFDDLSADVMSGIPRQTEESYLATLKALCELSPEHISAYGLTVEEGTPFFRMGERLVLPDEESARRMYFLGIDYLASQGLLQYEISNFAKEGHRSRHNLKYWSCREYLGLGPAAYSDLGGERFGNARDVEGYLSGRPLATERERPDRSERLFEYVMLRLRLSDGLESASLRERFGVDAEELLGARISRYIAMGLAKKTEVGYALTPEGMYVSNTVLSELLDFS